MDADGDTFSSGRIRLYGYLFYGLHQRRLWRVHSILLPSVVLCEGLSSDNPWMGRMSVAAPTQTYESDDTLHAKQTQTLTKRGRRYHMSLTQMVGPDLLCLSFRWSLPHSTYWREIDHSFDVKASMIAQEEKFRLCLYIRWGWKGVLPEVMLMSKQLCVNQPPLFNLMAHSYSLKSFFSLFSLYFFIFFTPPPIGICPGLCRLLHLSRWRYM